MTTPTPTFDDLVNKLKEEQDLLHPLPEELPRKLKNMIEDMMTKLKFVELVDAEVVEELLTAKVSETFGETYLVKFQFGRIIPGLGDTSKQIGTCVIGKIAHPVKAYEVNFYWKHGGLLVLYASMPESGNLRK